MINEPQITIGGNLTADPELRYTPTGQAVATFTVACNPRFRDSATGEWANGDSVFLRVTAWRNLAENIAESLRRGDPAVVIGRYRQRAYETREGEKRTAHEIQADSVSVPMDRHRVRLVKVVRETAPGAPESPGEPGGTHEPGDGADRPAADGTAPGRPARSPEPGAPESPAADGGTHEPGDGAGSPAAAGTAPGRPARGRGRARA